MKLYHFLGAEYGLCAIRDRRLKVARLSELNDPFEYIHFDTTNYVAQAVLKERKRKANQRRGLICLSARYDDPVQWAHYGDSHRGLCLGFEVTEPGLIQVEYISSRAPPTAFKTALDLPYPQFLRQALAKKFQHWAYEQEYRLIVPTTKAPGLVFHSFSDTFRLAEVLIGVRAHLSVKFVRSVLKSYHEQPSVSRVRASTHAFSMERVSDA